MKTPISITALVSVSPLGASLSQTWDSYLSPKHFLTPKAFNGQMQWAGCLPGEWKQQLGTMFDDDKLYGHLDDSVKYALFVGRKTLEMAGWKRGSDFGINIGSSRGATGLFEKYHTAFLQENRTPVVTSPSTTLGNISSWVGHDLQAKGPDISHSITCSTALHALINGVAWIRSGMVSRFMVGGSEAPLTPFTISQMQALKIYAAPAGDMNPEYPCRALDMEKVSNSMVLGEGASMLCLESGISNRSLVIVEGIGYATEPLAHDVSLSTNALCLQRSMKMALGKLHPSKVDVAVLHAPGTIKGDRAEYRAVETVFGGDLPALTSNKWKLGHTFGASGILSLELAALMIIHQQFISIPFITVSRTPSKIRRVLVNAVGFGGNAVSILLRSV